MLYAKDLQLTNLD